MTHLDENGNLFCANKIANPYLKVNVCFFMSKQWATGNTMKHPISFQPPTARTPTRAHALTSFAAVSPRAQGLHGSWRRGPVAEGWSRMPHTETKVEAIS